MKQLKKNHITKNYILYKRETQKGNLETLQRWCHFQSLVGFWLAGDVLIWL